MVHLAFVVALFCILPSITAVSVLPLLVNPRFQKSSEERLCIWSDGVVSLNRGKVSISVGLKSSILVSSKGETQIKLSKLKVSVEVSEPDSYIFIVTEKDEIPSTNQDHSDFILKLVHGTELLLDCKIFEHSRFDVAILKTIQPGFVNSNFGHFGVNDLLGREDFTYNRNISGPVEEKSETEDSLVENRNIYTTSNMNDDEMNIVAEKEEENGDQESLSEDEDEELFDIDAEVQSQLSTKYPKGEQFEIAEFDEPMIYASDGKLEFPQVVSSLTGKIRQVSYSTLKPFTRENRIPDDRNLLIVNEGNPVKYYKNIIKESKVWYLRRDEHAFYPCIVQIFSLANPKPTLLCIGLEPDIAPEVSWDDIFPIESTDMIKDFGIFKIQIEDINWNDISTQKEVEILQEREVQYFWSNLDSPFLIHSKPRDKEWIIIDSINGKLHYADPKDLVKIEENDDRRIPNETKMNAEMKIRLIILGSEIYYHCKNENLLIRGSVETIYNEKVTVKCINGRKLHKVEWDDVYPIESYELIEHRAPLWKPENSKSLPLNTDNDRISNSDEALLKEQSIVDDEGENNDQSFQVGEQLSFMGKIHPPFILLSILRNGKQCRVLNTKTGVNPRLFLWNFSRLPAEHQISEKTKISEDGKFKIILLNSDILYLNSDGTYYPCFVNVFSVEKPLEINCYTLGVITPNWDDIFPIEALSTLPKPLKIRGFEDTEAVTVDDIEKFINTETNFKTFMFRKTESIRASENLLDSIGTDTLVQEMEETEDQDTLNKELVDAEVQTQLGTNPKGQQFKVNKFEEPMIYNSNGVVSTPQFVSSLTGKIHQLKTKKWEPFTGKYRIPDKTKLLIVNEGDSKKYYKNITLGSKVWYLLRDEKALYPCIVEIFSLKNRKPTLICIGLWPATVPKVSWDDIFPIESTELINDLGRFAIKSEDINWDDLSKKKETKMTITRERKTPEAPKALPCKRKKNIKEKVTRKEQCINVEAE